LTANYLADKSNLFIYSDGPKSNANEEDINKIYEVRQIIKMRSWCKSVKITESKTNKGLARSIIEGVTEVLNKFERVIVLEDDLLTSPYFLRYMNIALELYNNCSDVASINGFFVPVKRKLPETFFLNFSDCLGWGTWNRSWALFEQDGEKLFEEIVRKNLSYKFDLNGSYNYTQMLADQANGKIDSWAIRWYASNFLENKLSLCPKFSLVKHFGNDGSGANFGESDFLNLELQEGPIKVKKIPVVESRKALKEMTKYFQLPQKRKKYYFIKSLIPPILLSIYRKLYKQKNNIRSLNIDLSQYGWFGNYATWGDAMNDCTGYESDIIIDKVKNSLKKVKNGKAVYERDSVIFNEIEYSFPLLAGLMWIAAQNHGELTVLDYGGSLGSTYYQNRLFLKDLNSVKWSIVEQAKFVDIGKADFEDECLKFYYSIDDCFKVNYPNVLILSGILQYLEKPYDTIKELISREIQYIIIDRNSFIKGILERITVQIVTPEIYKASYPAWFFNEDKFLNSFTEKYDLIQSFDSLDKYNIPETYSRGFLFRLNNSNE
jgi:putative methyltransferase (TIGR04325 family)